MKAENFQFRTRISSTFICFAKKITEYLCFGYSSMWWQPLKNLLIYERRSDASAGVGTEEKCHVGAAQFCSVLTGQCALYRGQCAQVHNYTLCTVYCAIYDTTSCIFDPVLCCARWIFHYKLIYIVMCRVKCEHGASFDRRNRFCSTGLFHIARDTVGKYPLICGWSVKQEYLRLPPKFGFTQKKIWIEPPPFGTTSKQHLFYISFLWVVSQVVTDIVAL